MDSKLYVNYLNHPKRARYDSNPNELLQQVLQASLWNNCLFYDHSEAKFPRKMLTCGEKIDLSAELKFEMAKSTSDLQCTCIYRSQNCQQHLDETPSVNGISKADHAIFRKPGDFSAGASNKFCLNSKKFLYQMPDRHKPPKVSYNEMFLNRDFQQPKFHFRRHSKYFPYSCKMLKRSICNFNSSMNLFSNCVSTFKSKLVKHRSAHRSASKSTRVSLRNSVLEADVLCLCTLIPRPITDIAYWHHCICFLIRKVIACHLYSTMPLKSAKQNGSNLINIQSVLKKQVEDWCKTLHMKERQFCFRHRYSTKAQVLEEKDFYLYSYYDKSNANSTFEKISKTVQLKDILTLFHKYSDEDQTESNQDVESVLMNKEADLHESKYGYSIKSLPWLPSHAVYNAVGRQSSEKRSSSRLKKKRDSGIQPPYSSDFIVEVPVSKKAKKSKFSHPYSHQLFWNFYENHKRNETYKWNETSRTYFKWFRFFDNSVSQAVYDKLKCTNTNMSTPKQLLKNQQSGTSAIHLSCDYVTCSSIWLIQSYFF